MKLILEKLFTGHSLNYEESKSTLIQMGEGKYNQSEKAAFLSAFSMRIPSLDELCGFRDAMLELSIKIETNGRFLTDLCGTGGDGKNTFNVSTACSFILAARGHQVAKHGNYSVSSFCGSSNVLEEVGFKLAKTEDDVSKQLDNFNLAFIHAPYFHPAMKHIAPVRKELSLKTVFNILGPLSNPMSISLYSVGVYSLEIQNLYTSFLERENDAKFSVVHSLDGYDEISLTGLCKIKTDSDDMLFWPEKYGFSTYSKEDLDGGQTTKEAAGILLNVLSGQGSKAQEDVVVANSAISLVKLEKNLDFNDCTQIAREIIQSKQAENLIKKMISSND